MRELLEVVAGLMVAAWALFAVTGVWLYRRVHRSSQLVRGRPSSAPLIWQWHPGRPARMHRRLQRVCRLVEPLAVTTPSRRRRARDQSTGGISAVALDLVAQALILDSQVVHAARLRDPWRRRSLVETEVEVGRLETAASRLAGLSAHWAQPVGPPVPLDINDRVDALQLAYEEVGRLAQEQRA